MEGDRRITLLEPAEPTRDKYGDVIDEGVPVRHVVWATRRDRGSGEDENANTLVGEWQTVFRVRREGIENVGHKWLAEDERGTKWNIERVSEVPTPPRRWLLLYCVAKS